MDPLTKEYPELTPYQFANNTPIWAVDLDGLEGLVSTGGEPATFNMTARDGTSLKVPIDIRKFGEPKVKHARTQATISVPREEQLKQHSRDQAIFLLNNVVADPQKLKEGDGVEWLGITPFGKFAKLSSKFLNVAEYGFKHIAKKGIPWEKVIESTKNGPAKFANDVDYTELTKKAWDEGAEVTNGKPWKVFKSEEIIGATKGKETKYMRVELTESTGELHSSPIDLEQFNKLTKQK